MIAVTNVQLQQWIGQYGTIALLVAAAIIVFGVGRKLLRLGRRAAAIWFMAGSAGVGVPSWAAFRAFLASKGWLT